MAQLDEIIVSRVVSEVLARLAAQSKTAAPAAQTSFGVYERMEDACAAAHRSFEKLRDMGVQILENGPNGIDYSVVEQGEVPIIGINLGRLGFRKLVHPAQIITARALVQRGDEIDVSHNRGGIKDQRGLIDNRALSPTSRIRCQEFGSPLLQANTTN